MKSLQEQIAIITKLMGVLNENAELRLKRRFSQLDSIISYTLTYKYDANCKDIKGGVDSIIEASISHFYHDYFSNLDDTSKEWEILYLKIEDYINKNWRDRITQHVVNTCR